MNDFNLFIEWAERYRREHQGQRQGQAYCNALHFQNPVVSQRLWGTPLDPFHNDAVLPAFLEEVAKLMGAT